MHRRYIPALLLAGSLVIVAACGGPAPQSSGSPAAEGRNSTPAAKSRSSTATKIDLDKIFPPGPGRELVLGNCQNCHTFAPIVVLQMDKEAWHRNSLDHRER